jgi:hypothetical protein
MTKAAFKEITNVLLISINTCFKARLTLASLILLYSSIDIMAWLNRPESKCESDRRDFLNWVDSYLLPDPKLKCSSPDLYGARCSLLHTATTESLSFRKGEARKIYYSWGKANINKLQDSIAYIEEPAIAIRIDDLIEAFQNGLQRFELILRKDKRLAELIYKRANKQLINIPDLPELPK